MIDRLEHARYARRVRDDEDRRQVKVEVTPVDFMREANEVKPRHIERLRREE